MRTRITEDQVEDIRAEYPGVDFEQRRRLFELTVGIIAGESVKDVEQRLLANLAAHSPYKLTTANHSYRADDYLALTGYIIRGDGYIFRSTGHISEGKLKFRDRARRASTLTTRGFEAIEQQQLHPIDRAVITTVRSQY
jgi:hypothetical protein